MMGLGVRVDMGLGLHVGMGLGLRMGMGLSLHIVRLRKLIAPRAIPPPRPAGP